MLQLKSQRLLSAELLKLKKNILGKSACDSDFFVSVNFIQCNVKTLEVSKNAIVLLVKVTYDVSY